MASGVAVCIFYSKFATILADICSEPCYIGSFSGYSKFLMGHFYKL